MTISLEHLVRFLMCLCNVQCPTIFTLIMSCQCFFIFVWLFLWFYSCLWSLLLFTLVVISSIFLCVSFSFRSTVQRLPPRPQNYSHYTVGNRIGMLHFMYEHCFHDNVHFNSCVRIRTRERWKRFFNTVDFGHRHSPQLD